jgi:hypothetical protein
MASAYSTAGWLRRTESTSNGDTLDPPRTISSLIRPVMNKYGRPSGPGCQKPSSPLWNQPPWNTAAVASGWEAYSRMTTAPRTASSPRSPVPIRLPSASSTATSTCGRTGPMLGKP